MGYRYFVAEKDLYLCNTNLDVGFQPVYNIKQIILWTKLTVKNVINLSNVCI